MGLARMAALDEEALICDFAESYHVLDWRGLPVKTAATLARGLRPSSRIMQKMGGTPAPPEMILLAAAVDALRVLVWQNTRDGVRGHNRPESVLEGLLGADRARGEPAGFATPAEFDAWRAGMMMNGGDRRG